MKITNLVVIGSGTMGSGIAQWFAQQGIKTELVDINQQALESAYKGILASWDKLVAKGKFTTDQKKEFTNNLSVKELSLVNAEADLVIEAIVEDIAIKTKLFQQLDKQMNSNCILASNTSSIPMATMAKSLKDSRKEKFIGLHFFNPAPVMKLVEIIRSPWTDIALANELEKWFSLHGKKPAQCSDAPGFIVNRVARNFYGEAFRICESRQAEDFKKHDEILKKVGGFRMGPFELMDLIGIDVNYDVTCSVWEAFYREARFQPHLIQKEMVDSGRLGRKTKQGFYKYE